MLKVYIAFGFHVNLYHSFREDTNDRKGFAGDIRVIRHIIEVLDRYNAQGVPVKGTWDFENAFSLEETLPVYAPDIISNVQRRTGELGDEQILMGYNNGSFGAQTKEELEASLKWAITNSQGSGILDLFGSWAPLVRPQEMMFSPSQVSTYRACGIEALCLYYSAIPFDGFRTLIPLLPFDAAFNPLSYRYRDDTISIIPTYNTGDMIDFGALSGLAHRLHKKQASGEINRDVLIFINMDADSEHWYGLGFPPPLNKLPNLSGLSGLIDEVKDLPFVEFDTPGNYLISHPPAREVIFTHDIADGSFDGYSSWAEKPFNRQIWTRIERARAGVPIEGMADTAFAKRVRLLSTTHFGLSTPHLNIRREAKALALSTEMLDCVSPPAQAWSGGRTHNLRYCLPISNGGVSMPPGKGSDMGSTPPPAMPDKMELHLPRIIYGGKTYPANTTFALIKEQAQGFNISGQRFDGVFSLPGQKSEGYVSLSRFTVDSLPCIFCHAKIDYPYTFEKDIVYNEIAALMRPYDNNWDEVLPFEIKVSDASDAIVLKRNYEGDISSFSISSFEEADPKNKNLDSFNHQVTNGVIGIQTPRGGFLLAVQKMVSNSMAVCPMRLRDGALFLNPFGTYKGRQRNHATHGSGLGAKVSVYAAPQYSKTAPAYNGASEEVMLALFPFDGEPPQERMDELWNLAISFSEGSIPAEEWGRDFSVSRPAQGIDETIEVKKLARSIPLMLQARIMISSLWRRK